MQNNDSGLNVTAPDISEATNDICAELIPKKIEREMPTCI